MAKKEPVPIKHPPDAQLAKLYGRALTLAQALPGVEDSRSYGTPAIKVKGKLIARLRSEAEGGLAIQCDFVERDMLLQADPEAFYTTDHYAPYPMILVNLSKVRWDAMPQLLEAAWRQVAPKRLVKEWEQNQ